MPNIDEIVAITDQLMMHAIGQSASDVHIMPTSTFTKVSFRILGCMTLHKTFDKDTTALLISRLKVMANLNIAEQRLPQDGHIHLSDQNVSIRVSTCPCLHGEKVVLRFLYFKKGFYHLDALGMTEHQLQAVKKYLGAPSGLILICGPTGSGKSNTLYAALDFLKSHQKNIVSIEDPVEIELEDITQININTKLDFDFSQALRTILRQDPDIIMVGEIRDHQTAKVAFQAAQTGHLVLASIHARCTESVFKRLKLFKLQQDEIFEHLLMILSQRLVKTIGLERKRTGIFEVRTKGAVQKSIENSYPLIDQMTLQNSALLKVSEGIIEIDDVHQVLGTLTDEKAVATHF